MNLQLRGASGGEATALPRMRVLMTVDAVGGVWRFAMEIARPLRRLGVDLVLAGLGPRPQEHQLAEAANIARIEWLPMPLDWMADGPDQLAGVTASIERLAVDRGCDLVHVNLPSQAAGRSGRLPMVAMSHSCLPSWWSVMRGDGLPESLAWHQPINREGLIRADAVVVPSASHADRIEQVYGLPGRIEIIHNGIGGFYPRGERQAYAFAAGRWWDEGKNGAAIDAAARLSPMPIRVAGATRHPDGSERDGPSVGFRHAEALGPLAHKEVIEHMRHAALVISASRYEPFGLAALEGARCGTPLILSDIATYRELWRGAAIFFDPFDPQALAVRIGELAEDAELRRDLGQRALARSRRFTPNRQARALRDLWAELAGVDRAAGDQA